MVGIHLRSNDLAVFRMGTYFTYGLSRCGPFTDQDNPRNQRADCFDPSLAAWITARV